MTLTEEQADKVVKGVETLQKDSAAVSKRFEDFQTSTKTELGQALAQIKELKENANSQAAIIAELKRSQVALNRETTRGLDPIARFCASEERCNWLVGNFKRALGMPLAKGEIEALKRTAITGVDSGIGGAVTPQETNAMIYDALLTYGQWNTLGVIPVGSRTQVLPLITVRPTAYWVAQGAQITEGAMTGSSNTLTIKEAAAWIPVARALLEDAEGDMASYILRQLAEAVAYRLDWACFAADGTNDTTDGAYTGIAVGGTAATAADGNTTVANLDLDDFARCLTTVSAGVLQRPCRWWIHPQILAKIVLIRDGNGRPIFQNALEAPAPGAIGSILGYPVTLTGAMPSTDSAGQVVAVFGEPAAGAVGLRKQFEMAQSDEFQFDYNRRAFRLIVRAGFAIQNATSFAMLTTAAS